MLQVLFITLTKRGASSCDIVGISIQNTGNQQDRSIGLSFGRSDVLWSVFDKGRNLTPDTRLWILSRFMCIRSECL